jgi:hypothetical protein
LFEKDYEQGDHPDVPYALPEASIDFLIELARQLNVTTVFEFGSGISTAALLNHGFSVTSLEDHAYWMEQTLKQIPKADRERHTALIRPLSRCWHDLVPQMDWRIDAELTERLQAADLILIDSPAYVPFRESTLWSVLNKSRLSVVVVDDTRIHTLSRSCDRMAAMNPGLLHQRVAVGHSFDLFARLDDAPLRVRYSPLEILKGWRRFFLGRRFLAGVAPAD